MTKKKVLSLFSGCGGMDIGFEGKFMVPVTCINQDIHQDWITQTKGDFGELRETIFKIAFANDILEPAQKAWSSYFKKYGYNGTTFHLGSIVDLVKAHKEGKYKFPNNIEVVTGGFPCQDFSVSGKRKGFKSDKCHNGDKLTIGEATAENRGQLYLWMKQVIEITKPKVFIAENVKGLISLGDAKKVIETDFSQIDKDGYLVVPAKVLFAGDYGVPQRRERIIFFGFNKKHLRPEALKALSKSVIPEEYDPYPIKTHYEPNGNGQLSLCNKFSNLKPYVPTREVLKDLLEPELALDDLSQQHFSKAKFCGKTQGQTEINPNGLAPTIRAEHHGNIEYRRLSVKNGGKILEELEKGLPERRLTVRECARFQTFPDDFMFVQNGNGNGKNYTISASSAYKLIGNAVPPLLAYHIAKRLESLWDKLFVD